MKAFVINGSPRKKWNTTQAIDKAGEALKDNGFEVERIDLYDYTFKGCTSCFECLYDIISYVTNCHSDSSQFVD